MQKYNNVFLPEANILFILNSSEFGIDLFSIKIFTDQRNYKESY